MTPNVLVKIGHFAGVAPLVLSPLAGLIGTCFAVLIGCIRPACRVRLILAARHFPIGLMAIVFRTARITGACLLLLLAFGLLNQGIEILHDFLLDPARA